MERRRSKSRPPVELLHGQLALRPVNALVIWLSENFD